MSETRKIKVSARGVSVSVDPEIFNDRDFNDALIDNNMALFEQENAVTEEEKQEAAQLVFRTGARLDYMFRKLLFPHNWESVKNQLRDEDGKLSVETTAEFFADIMEKISALKK